jgi:hypothetical protein
MQSFSFMTSKLKAQSHKQISAKGEAEWSGHAVFSDVTNYQLP